MEAWIPALSFASLVGMGPLYTALKHRRAAVRKLEHLTSTQPPIGTNGQDFLYSNEKEIEIQVEATQPAPPAHKGMSEEDFLWCVASDNLEAVKRGIDKEGMDVNTRDKEDGCTALFIAAEGGFEDIVEFLLTRRANCELFNHNESAPLFIASMKDNVGVVKLLLKYGADVNVRCTEKKMTPTFVAALKGLYFDFFVMLFFPFCFPVSIYSSAFI